MIKCAKVQLCQSTKHNYQRYLDTTQCVALKSRHKYNRVTYYMYVSVRRKHGMTLRRVYIRRYSEQNRITNHADDGTQFRQCTENLARAVIVVGNVTREMSVAVIGRFQSTKIACYNW